VDSDDQPLGRITDIYLDRDTGLPEWALVATPERRRTFVPLAGAARKGGRIAVAVHKAAVSDAPAIRPGRELSDGDAARLYGHYVGPPSGDRNRGARRARGRGAVARLRAAAAPPARSAAARLREAGGEGPEAGRSGRLRWLLSLVGLGSALVAAAVLTGRVRRRRAPGIREAFGRALGELLAAFRAALRRRRGRRWPGSLGGARRGGNRRWSEAAWRAVGRRGS
jgi:PRC-barrel domain